MLVPFGYQESRESRKKRLFNNQLNKARVINNRIIMFIDDIKNSTFYKDSEKRQILDCLKFLNKTPNESNT